MPIKIGIPAETVPGERRLPVVPEVVRKYQDLGAQVLMQPGAGLPAHFRDDAFAGVAFAADAAALYAEADVLLCVQPPAPEYLAALKPGSVLLGMLQPWADAERVKLLQEKRITAFALELLPRITRSQSMDALSSQAAVAGYECALIAADHSPKFFPMLTYAAGTIRPAKVLVIGAGVAGLQAIATARRIGAMVEAYDVRPETREQVESLGARFVDTGVSAAGSGGYARELTDEEKAQQAERLAKAVAQCDALITTAAIPGKKAPRIVTADMIARMKPGAVVVDMAAESGGNVEGTVPGEKMWINDVLVIGPTHIASRMPVHASEMYARNLFNFISPFIQDGALALDWEDEVMAGCCLTHAGELRHAGVRQVLGL
ncbi:NAD(P) transhydrogenase subunit alpha [Pseudothauera nasutitermitis]|uniref:proton-translocating NAD(P)(+) transhydrogenase n=1 Tax=Pseudothauera nasutitermitis TaxID=2565930 RepID=A0A4S4B3X9_9RHOO|nr:NAD(P) transhydrogenase subunit alpha [Pseudothauera nasutitermitis]THF67397.1 NAD(P) transhydrogenase subunit alpha [Pseudothauera nasutitermitis]